LNKIITSLLRPVDISSIVFFRIVFGIILFLQVGAYIFSGYVDQIWIEPDYHFKYYGFHWVGVLTGNYLYSVVAIVSISALFIAIGFLYRISALLFFIGFTYLFLLEQSTYLNHYYLIILISFLLNFIPAHRYFSIDSLIWPHLRCRWISSWCIWILMFQIGLVYIFGGLAKINWDWLHGWPLRIWLDEGYIGTHPDKEFFVYLVSYAGLLFDLLIIPLLLFRKTRIFGFLLALIFHLTNKALFNIGIFPYISLAMTTLYFSPDWPRKLFNNNFITEQFADYKSLKFESLKKSQQLLLLFLALYIFIQIFIPLRHLLYRGNVSWTEEGHNFAWHMKLRDKNGSITFNIRDPKTGNVWELNPQIYLTKRQKSKLATRPYLAIQFAHYIEEQFNGMGYKNVEVRAKAKVSLNGRKKQLIIDPNIDLTMYEDSIMPAQWILPLTKPLEPSKTSKRPDPK